MSELSKRLAEAAERVREVNRTGAAHSAYTYPSQVYDTYGSLAILLELLPQTINQSAGWIATETDRRGVRIASGQFTDDPPAAAAAVEHYSGQAAGLIRDALDQLNRAHQIAADMAAARQAGDDAEGSDR